MKTFRLFFAPVILLAMSFVMSGCGQLGLPTANTFNQKAAVAIAAVSQIRDTATQLLTAGKISATDGENVLASTDAAMTGISLARSMQATNPTGADTKLQSVSAALTALQAYLAIQGK